MSSRGTMGLRTSRLLADGLLELGEYALQLGTLKQQYDETLEAIKTISNLTDAYSSTSPMGFKLFNSAGNLGMELDSNILQLKGAVEGTADAGAMLDSLGFIKIEGAGGNVVALSAVDSLEPYIEMSCPLGGNKPWISLKEEAGIIIFSAYPTHMEHASGFYVDGDIIEHGGIGLEMGYSYLVHPGIGLVASNAGLNFTLNGGPIALTIDPSGLSFTGAPTVLDSPLTIGSGLDLSDLGISINSDNGYLYGDRIGCTNFSADADGISSSAVISVVSDAVQKTDSSTVQIYENTYTPKISITVPANFKGSENGFRVKWTISNIAGDSARTKIYVNGVAVGVEKIGAGTHSDDIGSISAGDTIEIWGYTNAGDVSEINPTTICGDLSPYLYAPSPSDIW